MKQAYLTIGILLIVILAGILVYNFAKSTSTTKINQECSNQDGYCVYGLPEGYFELEFFEPSKSVNGFIQFDGDLSEYLIQGNAKSWDLEDYKCVSTDATPIVIEYFYYLDDGSYGEGLGHRRRAIFCGDDLYFVEDFTSSYGPRLYGPFYMKSRPY